MKGDAKLERVINKLIIEPAFYDVPPPTNTRHPIYGYAMHQCTVCAKLCLVRGGYMQHYIKAHNPKLARNKAKAIIAAVRKHDRSK